MKKGKEKQCQQCGICCYFWNGRISATDEDIERWTAEGRQDILRRVDGIDLWINPKTNEEYLIKCPYLKFNKEINKWICRIHNTKPDACKKFKCWEKIFGEDCLELKKKLTKLPIEEQIKIISGKKEMRK